MSQDYGIAVPPAANHTAPNKARPPARYLIVIDSGGAALARLFLENRQQVAEFDGGAEEVGSMIDGLQASKVANASDWDVALAAHTDAERRAADVYTLDI